MNQMASIIVNNYNYGRYLRDAIDSALNQTYPNVEVIVVDDGSTDDSRDIISTYGDLINSVLKDNGGMASTYNVGFPVSRGDVVLILDSDDTLLPTAVSRAVALFECPDVVKVHWPLWEVDGEGARTGAIAPQDDLDEGSLRDAMIKEGPWGYTSPPTSGNAWSRRFLESVLPAPEAEFRQHADSYLVTLAPVYGRIAKVPEPQGCYRVHGRNDYACQPLSERNHRLLETYDHRCLALSKHLANVGISVNPEVWKEENPHFKWMEWLYQATRMMTEAIPAGSTFILVDAGQWSATSGESVLIRDRRALPFLEREGKYWGAPADDATAIQELERLRDAGATSLVIAWPAFWWLDHYTGFDQHLRSRYHAVLQNDQIILFDLR